MTPRARDVQRIADKLAAFTDPLFAQDVERMRADGLDGAALDAVMRQHRQAFEDWKAAALLEVVARLTNNNAGKAPRAMQ